MENLFNISQSVNIGESNVMEVAKYISGRKCGGLLAYTKHLNELSTQLKRNFDGGTKYKYSPSTVIALPVYHDCVNREDVSEVREVGDFYGNKLIDSNSLLHFLATEDLKTISGCILKKIVQGNKNYNEHDRTKKYRTFSVSKTDTLAKKLELGDLVEYDYSNITSLGTNVDEGIEEIGKSERTKQTLKDSGKEYKVMVKVPNKGTLKRKYSEMTISKPPFEGGEIDDYSAKRYKEILSTRDSEHNELRLNYKPQFATTSERQRLFFGLAQLHVSGLTWDRKENVKGYLNHYIGLYDFYKAERDKYKTHLPSILYPNTLDVDDLGEKKKVVIFWTHDNQYGVDGKTFDQFFVGQVNNTYGNVSIKSDFKVDYRTGNLNNRRQYVYFNENGVNNFTTTNISDDVSVVLDNGGLKSPLLRKTNNLFRNLQIGSIINRFYTGTSDINEELMSGADSQYGLSRGRNLFNKGKADRTGTGFENPYCRTWTAHHQYSKLQHCIRPFKDDSGNALSLRQVQYQMGELRTDGGNNLANNTVLRDDGLVRITPTHGNTQGNHIKQYMFSIENLAWKDVNTNLNDEQRGEHGGRIMWFPPYNLRFSENINVSWNAQNFIGRGEEMYTYTNTIRSGTLDFTLLIDHPSIINKWRGTNALEGDEKQEREETLLRFFAGEGLLGDGKATINRLDSNLEARRSGSANPKPDVQIKKITYVIFFPFNYSGYDQAKEDFNPIPVIDGTTISPFQDFIEYYNNSGSITDANMVDNQLEKPYYTYNGITDEDRAYYTSTILSPDDRDKVIIKDFDEFLKINDEFSGEKVFGINRDNIEHISAKIIGVHNNQESGKYDLGRRRATTIKKFLLKNTADFAGSKSFTEGKSITLKNENNGRLDSIESKTSRVVTVNIEVRWKEKNAPKTTETVNEEDIQSKRITSLTSIIQNNNYLYDNEYLYFSELQDNKILHKYIVDRVRYFDPTFHSITPEGFNARLTFLHQCTRQGPTTAVSGGDVRETSKDFLKFAGNLSFGRPPFCILRIGDFFHTKICIDSISIQYDNSGVQWDMNPEGIGLQPMFANISISFKFLGGQDLSGPIERLQNAVTANYYANASVYSRHADDATHYYDAMRDDLLLREKKE